MAKKEHDKLPAVRETSSVNDIVEGPGHDVLGYLQFVSSEIDEAIALTKADLEAKLYGDDASAKIKAVSDLRAKRRKLTKYISNEVVEVKTMISVLRKTEEKAVTDALTSALQAFIETYEAKLNSFTQEFDA